MTTVTITVQDLEDEQLSFEAKVDGFAGVPTPALLVSAYIGAHMGQIVEGARQWTLAQAAMVEKSEEAADGSED